MRARPVPLILLLSLTACDIADPEDEGDRRTDPWEDVEPIDCEEHPCHGGCLYATAAGHCGNPLFECLAAPREVVCEADAHCGPWGTAGCLAHRCVPTCDEAACAQSCTAEEGCRCELGACIPTPCSADDDCPAGRCVAGRCGGLRSTPPTACAFHPSRLTVVRGRAAPAALVLTGEAGVLLTLPAELPVSTVGGVDFREGRVHGRAQGGATVRAAFGEVTCALSVEVVAPPAPDETLLLVVDEQDGAPLEGARVRTPTHARQTDAAGVARLPGLGLRDVELLHLDGYETLVVGVPLPQEARLPLRRRALASALDASFLLDGPHARFPSRAQAIQVVAAGFALAPTFDGLSPGALLGRSRRAKWPESRPTWTTILAGGLGTDALDARLAAIEVEAQDCPGQRCTVPTVWSVSLPSVRYGALRRTMPDLGPDWAFDLLMPGEGREVGLALAPLHEGSDATASPLPPTMPAPLQLHVRVPPLDVGGERRWGTFVGALAELPGRGLVVRGLAAAIDPERDDDLSDGRLSDPPEATCHGVPLRVGPRPSGATGPWRLFAISAEPNPTRAACPWDRPCVDGLTLVRSEALHDGAVYDLGERFLTAPTAEPPAQGVTEVKYCAEDPDAELLVARWTNEGTATTWLRPIGCGVLELPDESGVHALADAGDGASLTLRSVRLDPAARALFDPDGPGLDHALRSARAITTTRVTAP